MKTPPWGAEPPPPILGTEAPVLRPSRPHPCCSSSGRSPVLTEPREEGVVGTSSLHLSQTKAVGDLETHSLGLAGRGEDAGSRAKPLTASRQMVPDQVKAGPCWGRGNTLLLGGPHTWGRSASRAQCESRGAQGRPGDGLTRRPPGSSQHPLSLQAVWLL